MDAGTSRRCASCGQAITPGPEVLARFATRSHAEPGPLDTPCIVWDGCRDRNGYGRTAVSSRSVSVHRAAWEARHGPIPAGLLVCHRCDNPACWADGHLFVGSHADNIADMVGKGRSAGHDITHCPHGHPYDEANTYRNRHGHRTCRTCRRNYLGCPPDKAEARATASPGHQHKDGDVRS